MNMMEELLNHVPDFPQGEPRFVNELKSWKAVCPHWDKSFLPGKEDADFRNGLFISRNSFPDPENLLDTVYDHLDRFRLQAGLSGNGVELKAVLNPALEGESYILSANTGAVTVEAGNTEGARRGLYAVEEELCSSPGLWLKRGKIRRDNWIKNRISRCFFGPIKRPPFNHDELMDDIDYYPDAYLDRLAQEGINGLWLTIAFSEICSTSFFPEDPDGEKRRAKLRESVEKCRRYGIRLWVFAIEPRAWSDILPKPETIPDGPEAYNLAHTFCPDSPESEKYLYESTRSLFSKVPHLGGLILISIGERPTSCLSCRSTDFETGTPPPCQKKCGLSAAEILAKVLKPLKQGIKDASPESELISWFYLPEPYQLNPWLYELPEQFDKGIIAACNFESGCTKMQLGKLRTGGDYWLSCAGPSERFGRFASAAKGHCSFAAKLQVGCSHETADIPFIPAPGHLYRKYREMKRLGVEHVIQCWYFGNYPGLMNRTAGKLAYEQFEDTEHDFLLRLARSEWGKHAEKMAQIWEKFADAYRDYPLDYEFQYYGPMHDGAVWPLHLKNVHRPLPRTWKPDIFAAGDAMGEALSNFTLEEAAVLARRMSEKWSEGLKLMREIADSFSGDPERRRDFTLADALNCHFRAGADILEFYLLRNRMLKENSPEQLDRMEELLKGEIPVSEHLAELCKEDSRLGYHSEAEVYKYFPDKLFWRVRCLKHVLEHDFPECRAALANGRSIREILDDEAPLKAGEEYASQTFRWKAEQSGNSLKIELAIDDMGPAVIDNLNVFIGDRQSEMHPWTVTAMLLPEPEISDGFRECAEGTVIHEEKQWKALFRIPLALLPEDHFCRIGFLRMRNLGGGEVLWENFPAGKYSSENRLHHGNFSPDRMKTLQF